MAKAIITDGRVRHAWMGVGIGDIKNGVKLGDDGEPEQKGQDKAQQGLAGQGRLGQPRDAEQPGRQGGRSRGGRHHPDRRSEDRGRGRRGRLRGRAEGRREVDACPLRDGKASKSQVTWPSCRPTRTPWRAAGQEGEDRRSPANPDARDGECAWTRAGRQGRGRHRGRSRTAKRPRRDFTRGRDRRSRPQAGRGAEDAASALHAAASPRTCSRSCRGGTFLFVTVAAGTRVVLSSEAATWADRA
jgi:hypothetical protein